MDTNRTVKLYRRKFYPVGEPDQGDSFLTPDPSSVERDRDLVFSNEEADEVLALHDKVKIADSLLGPQFAIETPNPISDAFDEDHDLFRADNTGMGILVKAGLAEVREEQEDDIVEDISA